MVRGIQMLLGFSGERSPASAEEVAVSAVHWPPPPPAFDLIVLQKTINTSPRSWAQVAGGSDGEAHSSPFPDTLLLKAPTPNAISESKLAFYCCRELKNHPFIISSGLFCTQFWGVNYRFGTYFFYNNDLFHTILGATISWPPYISLQTETLLSTPSLNRAAWTSYISGQVQETLRGWD